MAHVRMYHAIERLQRAHLEALQKGEGRGLSTQAMAEFLDLETGYTTLQQENTQLQDRVKSLTGQLEDELVERQRRKTNG